MRVYAEPDASCASGDDVYLDEKGLSFSIGLGWRWSWEKGLFA